jgi:hypothetical protein
VIEKASNISSDIFSVGNTTTARTMASEGSSLLQRKYIDYIYMPGALLVFGTLIVKKEWAPYAALLAVAWGLYNFNAMRELLPHFWAAEMK